MNLILQRKPACYLTLLGILTLAPVQFAFADSGLYVGGSVGSAGVELDEESFDFNEDDAAWKAFAGYNFDILIVDLAVEGGYVDFGSPSGRVTDITGDFDLDLDISGWSAFALAGVELGPVGVFAKAGLVGWTIDSTIGGVGSAEQDGTDPAYGVGARFSLFSLEFRAEYERFEIDLDDVDSSDLDMVSLGVVWTF
ncbi:MAG TPA: outer membrane beta-barrel protein [Woeseiaceae bacterium]|nr:outer membrane beta-barrel protein [Woeseiaceae bacterium]